MDGWNVGNVPYPNVGRYRRKEIAKKLAEGHSNSGYSASLDHQKQSPSVEEAPQRPQRFAQINVLPASLGHHGRQFAIRERAHNSHESGNQPGAQQQRRRVGLAGNFGGHNKDAGADHGAHDQRGGAGEAQTFHQFRVCSLLNRNGGVQPGIR